MFGPLGLGTKKPVIFNKRLSVAVYILAWLYAPVYEREGLDSDDIAILIMQVLNFGMQLPVARRVDVI